MKSVKRHRLLLEQTLRTNKEKNYQLLIGIVLDANSFLEPYRRPIKNFLEKRQYGPLIEFADSLGATVYPSPAQHYAVNQLVALIKKYPFEGPIDGINPVKKALEVFGSAERLCRRYNLIYRLERKLGRVRRSSTRAFMRDWISKVIGEKPDLPKIYALCDFGPGASVGVSGNATHMAAKLLAPYWSVTPTALPYALAAMMQNHHCWEFLLKQGNNPVCMDPDLFRSAFNARVRTVTYNKITLVPKTAKVHRTIAVEPLLNGYVQKGVDEFLRRRLYRHGIDLTDQSRNQRLARLGSLPDSDPFCTIDLSSASDLISLELARDMLPPEWFNFLNNLRSPSYKLQNSVQRYEKFVSMGNGFCFPLETLVFASVCAAAYHEASKPADFSVYGDDIIVRQSVAEKVLQTLRCIGFRHNPKKTFTSGPFRESCGADWYDGEDVRPITLDYALDSLRNVFKLHNLAREKERSSLFFHEALSFLKALVPHSLRYCRPYKGQADTAFYVERDEFMASPFSRFDRRTWSWQWKELVSVGVSDDTYRERSGWSTALMMAALRGVSSEAPFTMRRNARTRVRLISHHGGHSTWLPST